ncbi:hypothetical protein GCM10020295_82870 [Streptomyces cinereospinus]
MTTPPHSPGRLPAFSIGLTHVTLPTSQVQVNRLTELINEVTLGTDVIVIVVSPATHLAETDVDPSRFIWPTWQGRDHPRGPPEVEGRLCYPGPHLQGHLLRGPHP